MIAFKKCITFLNLACGIFVFPYTASTPVDTPIGKNLTALLSEPSPSDVVTDENALVDTGNLSYDAFITSDSTNNSSSEVDNDYNGTDDFDNSTFYQHDSSNDTTGKEEECEGSDIELIYYAGSSTILITVVFACVFLITLGCVTYHNILNLIP